MSAGKKETPVSSLRSRLASDRAKRIYLWFFTVVLTAAIALRAEAAIYARRIVSVVTELSTLRLGETSKAEALRRIPALHPCKTESHATPSYDAEECFSGVVTNGLPGRLMWRTENDVLSHGLRFWGFRAESLNVVVKFTSERVSYLGYGLWVSAPGVMPASLPPPPPDGELGVLVIGVESKRMIIVRDQYSANETHPPYRITPARSAPSQSIGIALTPDAPDEIVHRAFELRLNCIWSFGGCRRWNQLLPSVEPLTRN
jgi:hypothetical protein